MGSAVRLYTFTVFALLLLTSRAASQPQSSPASTGARVCVAMVNNHSSQSLFVERLTERLVQNLTGSKIKAVAMDSTTTSDRTLHPTAENSDELERRDCAYLVLTQVTDPKNHGPTEIPSPQVSIGRKASSTDAKDSLGGQTGSIYQENVEVNFAVFRTGTPKATLDTRILDEASANVSNSLMPAMDRVGNRISHELKKK